LAKRPCGRGNAQNAAPRAASSLICASGDAWLYTPSRAFKVGHQVHVRPTTAKPAVGLEISHQGTPKAQCITSGKRFGNTGHQSSVAGMSFDGSTTGAQPRHRNKPRGRRASEARTGRAQASQPEPRWGPAHRRVVPRRRKLKARRTGRPPFVGSRRPCDSAPAFSTRRQKMATCVGRERSTISRHVIAAGFSPSGSCAVVESASPCAKHLKQPPATL